MPDESRRDDNVGDGRRRVPDYADNPEPPDIGERGIYSERDGATHPAHCMR